MKSEEELVIEELSLDLQILEENEDRENESFLKNSIEEIEKVDALLKLKENEEKKIRLSRVQIEEESRNILSKLQDSKVPDAITNNCIEFINLINKQRKSDLDITKEDNKIDEVKQDTEKSKNMKTRPTFIERNIQLAKCGRGTLSMTEEESLRIKNLVDTEEAETQKGSDPHHNKECIYAFEDELRSKLAQIDEQLTVTQNLLLTKCRGLKGDPEAFDLKSTVTSTGVDEQKCKDKLFKNRLKEIDSLLGSMNSVSLEEVKPLPEPALEALIRHALESGIPEKNLQESEGELQKDPQNLTQLSASCRPFEETISELVNNAKSLMPKFKYRYDE